MKKALSTLAALGLTGVALTCYADGAIGLENFTVNNPMYCGSTLAPATPDIWIQVWAGGVALSEPFNLVMDGFFDNGAGIVPGVNGGDTLNNVVVQGWKGSSYASADQRVEVTLAAQKVGAIPPAPAPPALEPLPLPADFGFWFSCVPEPSTTTLTLLGAGALLWLCRRKQRRRFLSHFWSANGFGPELTNWLPNISWLMMF